MAQKPHPPVLWHPNDPEKKRTTHSWRDFLEDKERTGQHKNSFYWNLFDDITDSCSDQTQDKLNTNATVIIHTDKCGLRQCDKCVKDQ